MKSTAEDRDKRPDLQLPFIKKREDVAVWVYDHKIGVLATLIIYLFVGMAFVLGRVVINDSVAVQGFLVEFEKEPVPEQKVEEQKPEEKQMQQQDFGKVSNVAVNANAKLDAGLKDDRGTKSSDIYNDAKALEDKLNSGRQSYNKGLADEQDAIDAMRNQNRQGTSDRREESRVKGKVTVTYSLEGRQAVDLFIPAYQCEGGGEVVVNITVNRNGRVIAAAVARGSSDNCLRDMAVTAANRSRFNVDGSAPEKQNGTITYLFIAQ